MSKVSSSRPGAAVVGVGNAPGDAGHGVRVALDAEHVADAALPVLRFHKAPDGQGHGAHSRVVELPEGPVEEQGVVIT